MLDLRAALEADSSTGARGALGRLGAPPWPRERSRLLAPSNSYTGDSCGRTRARRSAAPAVARSLPSRAREALSRSARMARRALRGASTRDARTLRGCESVRPSDRLGAMSGVQPIVLSTAHGKVPPVVLVRTTTATETFCPRRSWRWTSVWAVGWRGDPRRRRSRRLDVCAEGRGRRDRPASDSARLVRSAAGRALRLGEHPWVYGAARALFARLHRASKRMVVEATPPYEACPASLAVPFLSQLRA
jgi:hypothetical protein